VARSKSNSKAKDGDVVVLKQRVAELEAEVAAMKGPASSQIDPGENAKRGHGVRQNSQDIEIALLGLLSIRDMWGYEVHSRFRRAFSHFWALPATQVYPRLRAMDKAGLVRSHTVVQDARPNRRVYAITTAGRATLTKWLGEPIAWPTMRHEFLFRLFLYDKVSPAIRIRELQGYIERNRELLVHWRALEAKLRPGLDGFYARSIAFQLQSLQHLMRFAETEITGAESVLAWLERDGVPSEPGQSAEDETHPLEAWVG
jgi:DNA-binding PadR family transcriptional regulator